MIHFCKGPAIGQISDIIDVLEKKISSTQQDLSSALAVVKRSLALLNLSGCWTLF